MKPISISLSPNVERDDVSLSLGLLFQPWKWKEGKEIKQIEEEVRKYIGVKYAVSFNSGRSSLMAILSALGVEKGGEVLLQAFTCNAAANPIIWAGLVPIYVDCDKDSFNIDGNDLERKIGPNSRVLMVQHTFGLPADMDEIRAICERHRLILIEDCAHSLGAEYRGQKVGTFGKAGFFSFGRDKIISSVWGGVVVTNDDKIAREVIGFRDGIKYPSLLWIKKQLLHPILMNYIVLPLYNILDLGKIFLVLSQWLGLLSKAVHKKEKKGKNPGFFPEKMPNALAILAINQFKKLSRFNTHRKELADYYSKELKNTSFETPVDSPERKNVFLRYTVKHKNAHEIIYQAWHRQNILVGDWYTNPVIPSDTNLESVKYTLGSCQTVERLSKTTLNLPTHINISKNDAQRIVDFLVKIDRDLVID